MARSHHRKKHKAQLRQFKHRGDTSSSTPKSSASGIFAFGGVVIGLAIGFFSTQGSIIWMIAGVVVGGTAGYFIGRRMDADSSDKEKE